MICEGHERVTHVFESRTNAIEIELLNRDVLGALGAVIFEYTGRGRCRAGVDSGLCYLHNHNYIATVSYWYISKR